MPSTQLIMDNSGTGPLVVPGLNGIPLNPARQITEDAAFVHGADSWGGERLTAREVSMLALMDSITDKENWDQKVFDEDIVAKWRTEATALPLISEKTWAWCLTELRDKAEVFRQTGKVLACDTSSRCVKSDVLVGPELRAELLVNVASLLNVSDDQKDWHPGSNGQVLNLVHPSLFPLVYGTTRILTKGGRVDLSDIFASSGQGEIVSAFDVSPSDYWSSRFQWLPCEVEFANEAGTDVRITSYINNLDPGKHRPLYGTIEKLIGLSIPLWNDVLIKESYGSGRTPPRIKTFGASYEPERPRWFYDSTPESVTDPKYAETMTKIKEWLMLPDNPDYESDPDVEYEEEDERWSADPEVAMKQLESRLKAFSDDSGNRRWSVQAEISHLMEVKWERMRKVVIPEPGDSFTYEEWKEGVQTPVVGMDERPRGSPPRSFLFQDVCLQDTFRKQGLQVIVKLASIELTPEKPAYQGGSWHLEGMVNEHIVATAIYYYDVENVTESQLSFRHEAELDELELVYEQDDHDPLCTIFGTASMRDEPGVQNLGSVKTSLGRLLVFPNTLQHSVGQFSLADKTKPGHRRFIVLWLVDPHYRICSTRNVPPQQHPWWAERARLHSLDLGNLPQELVDIVRGEVGEWPMGIEEAKRLRLELMAERTRVAQVISTKFHTYNLCEH
jgi:hypothetical protein